MSQVLVRHVFKNFIAVNKGFVFLWEKAELFWDIASI